MTPTERASPDYAEVILTVTFVGLLMAQGVRLVFCFKSTVAG